MNLIKITSSVLISNLPVLLPVVIEPEKHNRPGFWCLYALYFVLTLVYFWHSELSAYLKFSREHTNLFLQNFFKKIQEQAGDDSVAFLMRPSFNINPFLGKDKFFKKCLFDNYPLNLRKTLGFKIIRPYKSGIEGVAYKEGDIKVADFEDSRKMDSHAWNMQPSDLKMIGNFRSGIAVPIEDSLTKNRIIGVLVIYSRNKLEGTPFRSPDFQIFLKEFNDMISILIKGTK